MFSNNNTALEPTRRNAFSAGIWRAAATITFAVLLFVLVVRFASDEAIKSHFDKFIFGVFAFGIGVLVSLFVSKEDGFHLPSQDTLTRRAPAGLVALAFVVGAEVWWGQWSQYHEFSVALAKVCEKAKEAPEGSVNKIKMLMDAQQLAEKINTLWLKPTSVDVNEACYQ